MDSLSYFQRRQHPEMGDCLQYSWPAKLAESPARAARAPRIGEHTGMICREILKMPDEEFVGLLNSGVLR